MHIDERKYAYGIATSEGDGNRVMKSKYDIYLYGIQDINITNLSAKTLYTFYYDGSNSYVGDNGAVGFNIPYKYLTPTSIISVSGYIAEKFGYDSHHNAYYPLPYFEEEDNPGAGINIKSVVVHSSPDKIGSDITVNVYKHTHSGTWNGSSDMSYSFYFKLESTGHQ